MTVFPATIFKPVRAAPVAPVKYSSLQLQFAPEESAVPETIPNATNVNYDALKSGRWFVEGSGDGMVAASLGEFAPNISSNTSAMVISTASGSFVEAELVVAGTSAMVAGSLCEVWLDTSKSNWIAWSDVRSLTFVKNRKNVAGDMEIDWPGLVTNIKKIGKRMVVAGDNGVSFVTPVDKFMGINTVHRIGLLGRDAYAGNDFIHFFADKLGVLYQIDDTITELDYSEYLSTLADPVFSLDASQKILYMCDGTNGYAYSIDTKSFGKCAPNITGMGYQGGVLYPAAPAAITTPVADIVTDIYDFGTRKRKTIYLLDFGTNLDGVLSAAIESRIDKSKDFESTAFKTVSRGGKVKIIKKGVEFRFKLRGKSYEDFELDDFIIHGKIQAH